MNETELRQRENQAMQMHVAGVTLTQIGQQLDMSESGVSRMIRRALDRATVEGATAMRKLEGERLNDIQRRLMLVQQGNATVMEKIAAYRAMILLVARRAKLFGLDAPEVIRLDIQLNRVLEAVRQTVSEEDFERIAGSIAAALGERAPGEEPGGEAAPGSALSN